MIKTKNGFFINPLYDLKWIIESERFYVPNKIKIEASTLEKYYLSIFNPNSLVFLPIASVLGNLFVSAYDKKVIREKKIKLPQEIILWSDNIYQNIRQQEEEKKRKKEYARNRKKNLLEILNKLDI